MQNHNDDTIKTSDTVLLEKYTSHFIWKSCVWEGVRDRTELQHIDPPLIIIINAFLSRSPGLLNRGPGGPASLEHVLIPASSHQLVWSQSGVPRPLLPGAGFLYRIFSPTGLVSELTDFLSSPSYVIVQRLPSSCGRHKLHSLNPSTVNATLCYSSTGCTCYLHRCISYFDSLAGS